MASMPLFDDVIRRAEDATRRLGIHETERFALIRSYAEGPPVVAVAGFSGTGRSRVGAAVASGATRPSVLKLDIRFPPPLLLWDVLLIVSPADRALSQAEEDLAREASRQRCPVAVVITRVDLLGDQLAREGALQEIERFRLRPTLSPMGIGWFFSGVEDPLESVVSFVNGALAGAPSASHQRASLTALSRVLGDASRQLGERLAARERELNVLRVFESQVPLVTAHLEEEVKLARLSVGDALRTSEGRLFESASTLASVAAAWVSRAGIGEWSDIESPLRTEWNELLETAAGVVDAERLRFQEEIARVASKIDKARELVGLLQSHDVPVLTTWSTAEFEDGLDALRKVSLRPLFDTLRRQCQEAVNEQRSAASPTQRVVRRIQSGLQQLAKPPLSSRLHDRIVEQLEALVSARLKTLLEAALEAAEEGARQDLGRATVALRQALLDLRSELAERYAWEGAYGELQELSASVGRTLSAHGI